MSQHSEPAHNLGRKGTNVMRPKSKGSGIMISDFIEENGGYLALMQIE